MSVELKDHLGNKEKRRAFWKIYKDWGVWFEQPEVGETYYKFELPSGASIVVMEHLTRDWSNYKKDAEIKTTTGTIIYYSEHKEYFNRRVLSENELDAVLLEVKKGL